MVGVSPDLHGLGVGRRLMERTLKATGTRGVILHATEAGTPLYSRLGFQAGEAIHQFQGTVFEEVLIPLPESDRLRPIGRSDPPALAALDAEATGMRRSVLLAALGQSATGVVLDRKGAPAGFALLRRFGRGLVIGPVIAPDLTGAQALIGHFLGSRSGQFVRIDVPAECGLPTWLSQLGLANVGTALRMVRGTPPVVGTHARCFALASQAFG